MPYYDIGPLLHEISLGALPVIFAITCHEAAHGYVAYRLGDDTAWRMGRVTFNPARHVDLFGTILMPLTLFLLSAGAFTFGYAKPVPVSFDRLRHPRRDMILVALAGPLANLLLVAGSGLLLYLSLAVGPASGQWHAMVGNWINGNLRYSILFNVMLAVFNMIPLPPLDGGRVAVGLLPFPLAVRLASVERFGVLILVALLILLPEVGRAMGTDFNPIGDLISQPVHWVLRGINLLAFQ